MATNYLSGEHIVVRTQKLDNKGMDYGIYRKQQMSKDF